MLPIRRSLYLKITAITLVGFLLVQNTMLQSQNQSQKTPLDLQFDCSLEEYKQGDYENAIPRLERLNAVYENLKAKEKKTNCKQGDALLLLGVCREQRNELKEAEYNYVEAKKILGKNFSIPGLKSELKRLPVYKEIKKRKIPTETTGNVICKPGERPNWFKKHKLLLIAGGVVIAGVVIYLLLKKPPKRTLNVTVGEGVNGSPASGTTTYKKGAAVNYNYTLQAGYTNLLVKLDGNDVATNGQFKMYSNHTLTVSATKQYTLTVNKGTGLDGTHATGEYKYNPNDTVNYSYSLQNGYKDLAVLIDGLAAPASGSITMDKDRTLTASATQKAQFTLTVTRGTGVNGTPSSGTNTYVEGTVIRYNYSPQSGYKNLVVILSGGVVSSSGNFTMDKSQILSATASKIGTISNVTLKITVTFAGANIQFTHKVEVDGNSQIRQKYIYDAHYTTDWEQADKYTVTIPVTRGLGDMKIKQIAYTSDLAKVYASENSWLWWTTYKVEISDYQVTGGVDPGKPTLSKDEFELNVGPWNTPPSWVTEKTETITIRTP
jgi:hypothetical protein